MGNPGLNIIFKMQQRVFYGLIIWGALMIVSAITGVSSVSSTSNNLIVTHYSSLILRFFVMAVGCGLLCLARCVQKKLLLGWRLVFLAQALAWSCFIVGGTKAVSSSYPTHSFKDDCLFACLLALVLSPVAVYWARRWYKEKINFIADR
jgi:hypothetical protein